MEWLYYLSALFLVLLVLLNLGATIAIVRSDALEQFPKIAQGTLVWIVPLIGSLFVLQLLKESEPEVIPRRLVACSGIGWCFLWAYLRQAEDKAQQREHRVRLPVILVAVRNVKMGNFRCLLLALLRLSQNCYANNSK